MGTFTFKWPHAAEEVYVTGTFDNWTKSEQLAKVGDSFEKTVTLPETSDKIYYKFVVDGKWTTDHTAPQEKDHEGNENNVLQPENITKTEEPSPAAANMDTLNTVTPESTTAQLAGAVPLEEKKDIAAGPGAYPETPANELDKQFKVDPLPATEGAVNPVKLEPSEKIPEGLRAAGINDHVTLDKESYEKSDRIPGLEMALPPVTNNMIPESSLPIIGPDEVTINSAAPNSTTAELAGKVPLEPKVPEVVKDSQREAHVDPEASAISEEVREKAEVEEELLQKVPEAPAAAEGTAPSEAAKTMGTIGEAVAVAGAAAFTAAVGASVVAKDTVASVASDAAKKLPDSQQVATTSDAAVTAAVNAAVVAKDTVASVASDAAKKLPDSQQVAATSDAAVTAAGDAAVNAKETITSVASGAVDKLPDSVKQALPVSVQPAPQAKEEIPAPKVEDVSPAVPPEVKESIAESGQSPEAATNTGAVVDKLMVEAELLKEVKEVEPAAESSIKKPDLPAPKVEDVSSVVPVEVKESIVESGQSPEAATNATAVDDKTAVEAELLKEVKEAEPAAESKKAEVPAPKVEYISSAVPVEVKESITESGQSPEAATNAAAVDDKKAVEAELLKEVKEVKPDGESPKAEEAKPVMAQPETNGSKSAAPQVPASAPAESTAAPTISKPTEGASADAALKDKKKKNRLSTIFSKLKHKLDGKDKS
ncbi:hypothetical protein B0H66DRAFT_604956 [Apodospora peruviana]|uniref:AMP-activated protein kinase glycogen-binding domain-containing protein n=1 Tax=Apodospora peruviana TaxID=516989 RepID=A0AAE0I1D8_9PEZI|nr:hypothetical protein B0H66DRAFT_604956 [Apodospora peruviana]